MTVRWDLSQMDLFPFERKQLDCLEGDLRAEDPRLAAMFDVFTRLARGDGKPPPEGQFRADGPWREKAVARQRFRRWLLTVTVVLLVILGGLVASACVI